MRDQPDWMLHLRPDCRQDLLRLVDHGGQRAARVQCVEAARAHGDVPVQLPAPWHDGVGPRPVVCRITKRVGFLSVQQVFGLDHIIDLAGLGAHRVYQARFGVHAGVGLHAKVPLVARLAFVHLWVATAAGVLARTCRRNQYGIHHRARGQPQALVAQQVVDQLQSPKPELVLLQ